MKKTLSVFCVAIMLLFFAGCESAEEKVAREAREAADRAQEVYENAIDDYNDLTQMIDDYNDAIEKLK